MKIGPIAANIEKPPSITAELGKAALALGGLLVTGGLSGIGRDPDDLREANRNLGSNLARVQTAGKKLAA